MIDLAEKFQTLTIDFDFDKYEGPDVVLDSNLLTHFAFKVKVYNLSLVIGSLREFQVQLLNAVIVVAELRLNLSFEGNKMSEFLRKVNWKTQSNLTTVDVDITPKNLECLYKNIPQEIACKTQVNCYSSFTLEDIPLPDGRIFREIYLNFDCNYETYKAFKKIATNVTFR